MGGLHQLFSGPEGEDDWTGRLAVAGNKDEANLGRACLGWPMKAWT